MDSLVNFGTTLVYIYLLAHTSNWIVDVILYATTTHSKTCAWHSLYVSPSISCKHETIEILNVEMLLSLLDINGMDCRLTWWLVQIKLSLWFAVIVFCSSEVGNIFGESFDSFQSFFNRALETRYALCTSTTCVLKSSSPPPPPPPKNFGKFVPWNF